MPCSCSGLISRHATKTRSRDRNAASVWNRVAWCSASRVSSGGKSTFVAEYAVNRRGVAQARKLIKARQYVLNSDWGDVQPSADDENAYLERHSWQEYG